MRILIISQLPPPIHGSTIMTQRLCDALRDLGHQVSVVDRRFSRSLDEVGVLKLSKVLRTFGFWMRSWRGIFRENDVTIFFATNRLGSFLVDLGVVLGIRLSRRPSVFYLHTVGYSRLAAKTRWLAKLVDWTLATPTTIACLDEKVAVDVSRREPAVVVVPNATDDFEGGRADRDPRYVFLANLIPEKGMLDFIECARRIRNRMPHISFRAFGYEADRDHMLDVRSALASSDNAAYCGPISGTQKSEMLRTSRALVYPSRYPFEAQPLAIIEAFSAGTPVIAYDAGAISELVIDGVNGYVVKDIHELVESIERIEGDESLWKALSAGAYETYRNHHSEEVFSDNWSLLLEQTT